jgi:hypothetical protein
MKTQDEQTNEERFQIVLELMSKIVGYEVREMAVAAINGEAVKPFRHKWMVGHPDGGGSSYDTLDEAIAHGKGCRIAWTIGTDWSWIETDDGGSEA